MQKLRGNCINLMHLFVATRGEIFSLKFTKYRLAAGLRPHPLGELKRSPDPLAAIRGGLLLRGREQGPRSHGVQGVN